MSNKVRGSYIIGKIQSHSKLVVDIGNRSGESAFAMELYISRQECEEAMRMLDTRHVIVEKDFTRTKE